MFHWCKGPLIEGGALGTKMLVLPLSSPHVFHYYINAQSLFLTMCVHFFFNFISMNIYFMNEPTGK